MSQLAAGQAKMQQQQEKVFALAEAKAAEEEAGKIKKEEMAWEAKAKALQAENKKAGEGKEGTKEGTEEGQEEGTKEEEGEEDTR